MDIRNDLLGGFIEEQRWLGSTGICEVGSRSYYANVTSQYIIWTLLYAAASLTLSHSLIFCACTGLRQAAHMS